MTNNLGRRDYYSNSLSDVQLTKTLVARLPIGNMDTIWSSLTKHISIGGHVTRV